MYLSREEEGIYQGEQGETLRRMMEILVALGDIYGAERLVPVRSVQIAGVSYKNIGEAGLEWISDLQGRVAVPSILNPAGMDLCRWKEMGIGEEFARKQQETIEAYRKLGVAIDCTCTPYQIYDLASLGDHLAWSESSAVSYANSVIAPAREVVDLIRSAGAVDGDAQFSIGFNGLLLLFGEFFLDCLLYTSDAADE